MVFFAGIAAIELVVTVIDFNRRTRHGQQDAAHARVAPRLDHRHRLATTPARQLGRLLMTNFASNFADPDHRAQTVDRNARHRPPAPCLTIGTGAANKSTRRFRVGR